MAHTNQTANYDLSQFIGTDIPNPLTDYNGDMEKIDVAIKAVADATTTYAGDITALEIQNGSAALTTTAQTLSGAVNELDADTGDLQSRMTVAEGKITADESTLATAVTNISTLAGKVSAIETQNGSEVLTTTASTLSGAINELDAEIGGISELETKVTALETQNGSETLVTTAQTLSGAINEIAAGGSSIDSAMSDSSENPVQNKVIKAYVDGLTVDTEEVQSGTLAIGDTSVTLTFAEQTISASTLIDVYTDTFGVNPTDVTYTASTVVLTFDAQESAVGVAVKVQN